MNILFGGYVKRKKVVKPKILHPLSIMPTCDVSEENYRTHRSVLLIKSKKADRNSVLVLGIKWLKQDSVCNLIFFIKPIMQFTSARLVGSC